MRRHLEGSVDRLAVRSVREEANLEARFGDAYREYRRRTGRFLPRLRALRTGPAG